MSATCNAIIHAKVSRGVLGNGTESFTTRARICGRPTVDGHDLCQTHINRAARWEAKLAAKNASRQANAGT